MNTALSCVAIAIVIVGTCAWWLRASVRRGFRTRHRRLLALAGPIADKLAAKEAVSRAEVEALARWPHVRPLLHDMLSAYDALELFPSEHLLVASQAEAQLAFWLMHPHEYQDPPEEMRAEAIFRRDFDGQGVSFHVLRFRMPKGHVAGQDWMLGIAGPFLDDGEPYCGPESAFSRPGDRAGSTNLEDLVDWYVGLKSSHS